MSLLTLPIQRSEVSAPDAALAQLVLQPVRRGFLRALAQRGTLSFTDIKRLMGVTDGNLGSHARRLLDAGVISCTKGYQRGFPHTEYSLTPIGRQLADRLLAEPEEAKGPSPS